MGAAEQFEVGLDERHACGQVDLYLAQLRFDAFPFSLDVKESGLDLGLGKRAVRCQVEQVLFFGVELLQLRGELSFEQRLGVILVVQGVNKQGPERVDEVGAELNFAVVVEDRAFESVDVVERLSAFLVGAEVVEVLVVFSAEGALEDEALGNAASATAFAAVEGATEVVRMDAFPAAGASAGPELFLDFCEERFFDKRFVTACVVRPFVHDRADVVGVLEQLVERVDRKWLGWALGCAAGHEPSVGELIDDVLEGVFAGCVELESEMDQGSAFRVDDDCADLTSFVPVDGVEVADRGESERAALLCLLAHLVGDVGAFFSGPEFVESGEDAVHELADRRLVDRLGCGDEGDSALLEVGGDDGVVESVPGHAGQFVDDDGVHVVVASDPGEHLLESDALGHLSGGFSWLDVLIDDGQAELFGFAHARFPLGGQRDAFCVVVGVDLGRVGDAEVDHRSL